MRLTEKIGRYSMGNKRFVGRKKNYNVSINFSAKSFADETEFWWYSIRKDDIDYVYNSLWEELKYDSKEECTIACEKKVDELVKQR